MMYLRTMGWFPAHTSLAMTPEHSATQWRVLVSEICKSRALQEHVPLITQSSSLIARLQHDKYLLRYTYSVHFHQAWSAQCRPRAVAARGHP